jgi:putative transposase
MTRPIITNGIYFITSVTYQRRKWFAQPALAQIVVDQWRHYEKTYQFQLHAYVVMPDHYHVVLQVGEKKTISQILHAVNSFTVTQINQTLGNERKVKIWQGNPWDKVIRDSKMYWQTIAYTLLNPWRAGLVRHPLERYPYSNIGWWLEQEGEAFLLDIFGLLEGGLMKLE